STLSRAVTIKTGTEDLRARILRSTSKPSIWGRLTSSTTRSNAPEASASSASRPVLASSTECADWRKARARASDNMRSSSTRRMRTARLSQRRGRGAGNGLQAAGDAGDHGDELGGLDRLGEMHLEAGAHGLDAVFRSGIGAQGNGGDVAAMGRIEGA